jgi:hypothetical protein
MDDETPQPPQRERIGSRAWVRTAGLVGGGLVAGGILAGTLTANAATDDSTTSVPSYSTEDGATSGGGAPEDCQEGAGRGATDQGATSSESPSGTAAT